jgi:hypothetical protein
VVAALSKRPRVRRRRVGFALAAAGLLGVVVGGISLLDDVPGPGLGGRGRARADDLDPAETQVTNPATATPSPGLPGAQTGQNRLPGPGECWRGRARCEEAVAADRRRTWESAHLRHDYPTGPHPVAASR